jgi:REP element-mobilizing transposase RayT
MMGRNPRVHYSGAVYHAMAHGVDGCDIFVDDFDRTAFIYALKRCAEESGAEILAYCLMGNHFHLAIKVGEAPLSFVIQRLLTGYSIAFNRRHGRKGHLFQARYKAIMCLDDRYLLTLVSYIHLNPVRAGLVMRPQDWPWSSLAGKKDHNTFESDLLDFDPWPKNAAHECELLRNNGNRRGIDEIGVEVSVRMGVAIDAMRSGVRSRYVVDAKRRLTCEAIKNGHALKTIAEWLHVSPSTMTRYCETNTENTGRPDTFFSKE